MKRERRVYLLDPQEIPPETIAVAFAKTSRSPESFDTIAAELTAEKSSEFHEKWVVGYGHASVAEHAVLHIAVENISRLAVETLESNRLASYTEKSTRYQKWGEEDYHIPAELIGSPVEGEYQETLQRLHRTYEAALEKVRTVVETNNPRKSEENSAGYERRLRTIYVDVCRYLLPAASLANVGMTINARALEYALVKLLSSPLAEARLIGREIKAAAVAQVPTLIKYADENAYMQQSAAAMELATSGLAGRTAVKQDWLDLVKYDLQAELEVMAALLYRHSPDTGYAQILSDIEAMGAEQRAALLQTAVANRGKFDLPPRELEHASYLVDLTVDQGAYFEIKRHRMMTQSAQPFSPAYGYAVPRLIAEAGMLEAYHQAMRTAARTYQAIAAAIGPAAAAYILPNGYNRRVLISLNWRAADHFISLRSAPNAHFAVRRAAQRLAEAIRAVQPGLGGWLRPADGETWQQIEKEHFIETETH